ncbi:protein JINGUBANG-like [Cornus florida]|uniref:protein JINGUBANG-like n=1 Tax=Cornus florida TaxID=4283 RepID=UPI00289E9D97|nr:protein JINGUBANG-like [Cornus florida]
MEVQTWLAIDLSASSSDQTTGSEMQSTSTISQETNSFTSPETNSSPSNLSHKTLKPSISHLCIATLKTLTPQISCLAVHNHALYAASINQINVFDLTNHALIDTFSSDDPRSGVVKSIAFGNGKIFTAHQDCKIRVWRISPSKRHRLMSTLPTVKDRLYRCISPMNYVQVRRHVKRLWIEHVDAISGLVINDGLIYSASWDKSFKVWKMSDQRCLESIKAHDDAVNAVAVSGDSLVYTASADGKIRVWERGDGERRGMHVLITTLEKHKSSVNALALNGDGSALFSGGGDRLILVWEREEGDDHNHMMVAWSLSGHGGAVLCLMCVDDVLVSGSSDRTVRVWQRGTDGGFCCVTVLEGHVKPVKSLVAVSGGSVSTGGGRVSTGGGGVMVYSGSLDGEVKVWQVMVSDVSSESPASYNLRLTRDV